MLAKQNVRSAGMSPKKISSFIRPVKDHLGLQILSTYIIECKKVYIGQTDRSTEARMKENHWHIQPGQPEKSVVAEHQFDCDHHIQVQDTHPYKKSGYVYRFIREVSS